MRNLKKILALVLALMMTLSLMGIASASDYTDASQIDADYVEAVEVLTGMGIFWGTSDTTFSPKETITRAEASALIYRALSKDVTDKQIGLYNYASFTDVPEGKWYTGYVTFASNGRYVVGDGNGRFYPFEKITGIQVLAILMRGLGYGVNGEYEGTGWEVRVLTEARKLGISDGISGVTFSQPATREVVARLLFNAIQTNTVNYSALLGYTPVTKTVTVTENGQSVTKTVNVTLADAFALESTQTHRDDYGRPGVKWTYNTGDKSTSVIATPVQTYYTTVSQNQLAADVNESKNFEAATYTNGAETGSVGTQSVVATSNTMLGARGRTTEVYNVNDVFTIVYIDTYLAEVTSVSSATYDTAGNQINKAKVTLSIGTTAPALVVESKTNFTYKKGDMLLVTNYGGADFKANVTTNGVTNNVDAIDIVEQANGQDVTISGVHTTGGAVDGVIAGSTTYLASNTYTAAYSTKYVAPANNMINASYTLYLDKQGNLLGMKAAGQDSYVVGIITAMEYVSVGTNQRAARLDVLQADGTTTTLNVVNLNNTTPVFFDSVTTDADLVVGGFVAFQATTLNGTAYHVKAQTSTVKTDADVTVSTGVANTLSDATGAATLVDDNTKFFVANYAYSNTTGQYSLQNYSVYTGFKNIPTLVNNSSNSAQINYYELNVGDQQYILLKSAAETSAYVQTGKPQQTVDTSSLFISQGNTYANYSEYNVVTNGVKTTVNLGGGADSILNTATAFGKIYAYSVQTSNSGANYYSQLTLVTGSEIASNSNASYENGVLTVGGNYLTVANECTVKLINLTNEGVYDATLDNIEQYSNNAMAYELDANGYISYLYIIL